MPHTNYLSQPLEIFHVVKYRIPQTAFSFLLLALLTLADFLLGLRAREVLGAAILQILPTQNMWSIQTEVKAKLKTGFHKFLNTSMFIAVSLLVMVSTLTQNPFGKRINIQALARCGLNGDVVSHIINFISEIYHQISVGEYAAFKCF